MIDRFQNRSGGGGGGIEEKSTCGWDGIILELLPLVGVHLLHLLVLCLRLTNLTQGENIPTIACEKQLKK